jgi:hypothetical protein
LLLLAGWTTAKLGSEKPRLTADGWRAVHCAGTGDIPSRPGRIS